MCPSPARFEHDLQEEPPSHPMCFDLSVAEILTVRQVSICINNKFTFLIDFTPSKTVKPLRQNALLGEEELGTETLLKSGKRKE